MVFNVHIFRDGKIDIGWEDGLVVEITGYSFRGPRLES